MKVLNIAHRGARTEAPENTLAAFEAAITAGADALELDVRLTADGRLAVIHDETVARTTGGRGRVAAMTLGELKKLDAGAWFDARFSGERIPSLEEVVDLAAGRAGLFVEVKKPGAAVGRIADALLRAIDGFDGEAVVMSFDAGLVSCYKSASPRTRVALLTESLNGIGQARRAGADAVSISIRSAAVMTAPRARKAGLECFIWTIRSFRGLAVALHGDVNGVITDYPRATRAVLDMVDRAAEEEFGGKCPTSEAYLTWRRRTLRKMKRWPVPVKRPRGGRA